MPTTTLFTLLSFEGHAQPKMVILECFTGHPMLNAPKMGMLNLSVKLTCPVSIAHTTQLRLSMNGQIKNRFFDYPRVMLMLLYNDLMMP